MEAAHDFPEKPEYVGVGNTLFKYAGEALVVDCGKELTHVTFQHPNGPRVIARDAVCKSSEAVERFMASLVLPARVRTRDEGGVEEGIEDAIERVMQETVADAGFMDTAGFRVGDVECLVVGMNVGLLSQVLVEREDVIHQTQLELLHVFALSLAAHERAPRFEEIIERDDILVGMSEFLDHKSNPPPATPASFTERKSSVPSVVCVLSNPAQTP